MFDKFCLPQELSIIFWFDMQASVAYRLGGLCARYTMSSECRPEICVKSKSDLCSVQLSETLGSIYIKPDYWRVAQRLRLSTHNEVVDLP